MPADRQLRLWLAKSLHGDDQAYDRLVRALTPLLTRFFENRLHVGGDAAGDLVQDVLVTLHLARFRFDPRRPLLPWLYKIARNKWIDRLRVERVAVPIDEVSHRLVDKTFEDRTAAHLDIEDLLMTLPGKQAQIIRRMKLEGMTAQDVQDETGWSVSDAKVSVHRGFARLRSRLFRKGVRHEDV